MHFFIQMREIEIKYLHFLQYFSIGNLAISGTWHILFSIILIEKIYWITYLFPLKQNRNKSYWTYSWMFFAYFSEPCTVINSDSSLIVDIEESRGNQVTQDIIPTELEISGTYILIMIKGAVLGGSRGACAPLLFCPPRGFIV